MAKLPVSDVVVLIPGITGSVLQKDGKDVWVFNARRSAWRGVVLSSASPSQSLELSGDDWEKGTTSTTE